MNRLLSILVLSMAVGVIHAGDFSDWLKRDAALRESSNKSVTVGDFKLKLPLGWVKDASCTNGVGLAFIGPRAISEVPQFKVSLECLTGNPTDRGGVAEIWPSKFSGWSTFELRSLWGVRAELPGDTNGMRRLVVQVPTSTSTLLVNVSFAGGTHPWDEALAELLKGLEYAGDGVPLAPPGQDGKARSVSRIGGLQVAVDALGDSPLNGFITNLRRDIASGVDPSQDNYVTLLDTGGDALLARVHLIRSAQHSIRIQTFIWGDDEVGRLMLYELIQAARRGVKVDVVMDHIASFRNIQLAAFISTVSPNLTFRHYRPACKRMAPNHLQETLDFLVPNRTNQRMHNKVFIVDDAVLITGGRNMDNSYYGQSPTLNFRDRDVLMVGPMVSYAVHSFQEYCRFKKCVKTARLKDVKKVIKKGKFKRLESRDDYRLHGYFTQLEAQLKDKDLIESKLVKPMHKVDYALFLADPPGKTTRRYTAWRRGTIARQLESVMRTAQNDLLIQTPYLVLDGGLLKIFKRLRLRSPDIRLVASSNSFGATDSPVAYAANFKMRPAYIKAGINVYEYMQIPADLRYQLPNYDILLERNRLSRGLAIHQDDKPFLCIHAKALVVDERMAFVGSFNFDPRSISLNTEVGLLVQDHDFTMAVKSAIERDILPDNSWVVAKRKEPRSSREVTRGLPDDVDRKHVNMWPFRFTSGYELKHGAAPIPPSVPSFYVNYRDIGAFPGADDSGLAKKKVYTCLSSTLSWLVVPLL